MKKQFYPEDWLYPSSGQQQPKSLGAATESLERAIAALEERSIDITSSYATWRDIGFAFAAEYQEAGREYFQRVSRFHPGYDSAECDKQYDRCLKSAGSGITIGSFFHHVKEAGIEPSQWMGEAQSVWVSPFPREESFELEEEEFIMNETLDEPPKVEKLPVFPERIYENLPGFLKKVVATGISAEEKDLLLLGALTSLSSCLPKIYGIYDGMKVYSNLYLFVTARASAGKGRLKLCKNLVLPIHRSLREEVKQLKETYDAELLEYNLSKSNDKEKPVKPPEKMLFIPANNSTTGLFQLLHDNNARGLIFETEADTLAQTFKSDYGNYSDGFCKAFHHETISYYRRTDREYVNLEEPSLSTVLSGTPNQVGALIPNAENGLFSRFMFYYMDIKPEWKDVFAENLNEDISEYYLRLGQDFQKFHGELEKFEPIKIELSQQQKARFNGYFSNTQLKYLQVQGEEYVATVRRMGLICYRLAMVLSTLRMMDNGRLNRVYQCDDKDFNTAMEMVEVLVRHNSRVFNGLSKIKPLITRKNEKERFLEALPTEFGRQQYTAIAVEQDLSPRTVERYIRQFIEGSVLKRVSQGKYYYPLGKGE